MKKVELVGRLNLIGCFSFTLLIKRHKKTSHFNDSQVTILENWFECHVIVFAVYKIATCTVDCRTEKRIRI